MRLSPQDAAAKWATRTQAASPDYQKGIQNVQQSPGPAAAAQANVAASNYQNAILNGTWKNKMQALTLGEWQQAAITKGVPRYGQGAQAATPRMQQFFSNAGPQIDSITNKVKAMPKGTLQQNIQRAVAMMEGMAALKGKV